MTHAGPVIYHSWYNYRTQEMEKHEACWCPETEEVATDYFPQLLDAFDLFDLYRGRGYGIMEAIYKVLLDCLPEEDRARYEANKEFLPQ